MPNYLPCLNPSCKSHGQSHPNCHCYDNVDTSTLQSLEAQGQELPGVYRGGRRKTSALTDKYPRSWAEGGEVEHYCSEDRPHKPDCPYYKYADGGDTAPDWNSLSNTPPSDATTPKWDSLSTTPPDQAAPNWNDLSTVSPQEKYSSPGQQLLTGVEGAAQGFLGPLATAGELGLSKLGVPGLTAEEQARRVTANPWEHGLAETGGLAAGLLTGTGEAGLINKAIGMGGQALKDIGIAGRLIETPGGLGLTKTLFGEGTELNRLGEIGAAALKNGIMNAGIQTGNEASNYLLGQSKNPSEVAANIASAGILGSAFGMLTKSASEGLKMIPDDIKLGTKLQHIMAGAGLGFISNNEEEIADVLKKAKTILGPKAVQDLKTGLDLNIIVSNNILGHALGFFKAEKGYEKEGMWGAIKGLLEGELYGYGIKFVNKKIALPVMLKVLRNSNVNSVMGHSKNILSGLDDLKSMDSGAQSIVRGIDNLFMSSNRPIYNMIMRPTDRDKLKNYVENGGLNEQIQQQSLQNNNTPKFAEGGEINSSPVPAVNPLLNNPGSEFISTHYPELGTSLMATKGRVINYLNSVRPQEHPTKLPFDNAPPTTQQERTYNRAVDLAIQPLGILNHIKDGSLTPEHMQHFTSMYPELHDHLQKKVTERILKSQLEDEKPAYKTRQAMSLFMGSPMDSSFTPASLQAAQGVFAQQQAAMAPQAQKPKKSTAPLSKAANNVSTPDQARAQRAQKG